MAKKITKKTVSKVTKKAPAKKTVKKPAPKRLPSIGTGHARTLPIEPKAKRVAKLVEDLAVLGAMEAPQQKGCDAISQKAPLSDSGGGALGSKAPHGIIIARAGTGKTFTEILGVANIYRDKPLANNSYTWKGPKGEEAGQFVNQPLTLWGKVEQELARMKGIGVPPGQKPPKVIPSFQQQQIWDFMARSKPRRVLYVAFNASIVEDFGNQYAWLVQALESIGVTLSFSTIHSLGNAACRQRFRLGNPYKSLNKYRTSDILSELWGKDLREVWKEKAEAIQAIQQLVGLCKQTLTQPTMKELTTLADHYGVLTNGDREAVFKDVANVMERCLEVPCDGTGRIDYNDMIWLPVQHAISIEQYDMVLVDEAQDLNRCQQELIMRAGSRIIVVGDDRQAIYGFAGADVDSIPRLRQMLNDRNDGREVEELRLLETRRCGKAIVEEARRFVDDFQAHEKNGEGKVVRISASSLDDGTETIELPSFSSPEEAKASPSYSLGEHDFVLCRVNAPLVRLAFKMLRAGKRVNIQGRDIGEGMKALIKKFAKGKKGGLECGNGEIESMTSSLGEVTEFLEWLDGFVRNEIERIQRRRNADAEAIATWQDKLECLRAVCEGAVTLKEVAKNIDALFKGKVCPSCGKSYDEQQRTCWECKDPTDFSKWPKKMKLVRPAGTLCSSVHRAKGLEAKRVFILRPDLMPHPKAKSAWEQGQEANLQYVAITRAIEELVYVTKGDEDE